MLRAFLGVALTATALGLPLLVLAVLGVPGVWAVVAACLVGVLLRLGFWLQRRRCPPCTTCAPCPPKPACICPVQPECIPADVDVDKFDDLLDSLGEARDQLDGETDPSTPGTQTSLDPEKFNEAMYKAHAMVTKTSNDYFGAKPGSLQQHQFSANLARACAGQAALYANLYAGMPKASVHAQRVTELYKKIVPLQEEAQKATSVAAAKKAADTAQVARFEAQDALLSAMMATTDPMRTVKVPPQPKAPKTIKCPTADPKLPLNRHQQRMLAFLKAKMLELLAHLLAKYPNDPATKNMHANWTREVLPLAQYTRSDRPGTLLMGAVGQQGAMCMVVNMMAMRPVPSSLNSLVHELSHMAHLTPSQGGHTAEFYHTHRRLMRIASDELKWTLEASCRDTCDVATDKANSRNPTGFCSTCQWADPAAQCKDFLAKIGVENVCRPMPKITSGSK